MLKYPVEIFKNVSSLKVLMRLSEVWTMEHTAPQGCVWEGRYQLPTVSTVLVKSTKHVGAIVRVQTRLSEEN